ncbi:MAG: T9SS type A sorting domain-containing protein, partial [Saprospiraceae bacterium]
STEELGNEKIIVNSPLLVYPNPVRNTLNVFIKSDLTLSSTLELIDLNGKRLESWSMFEKGATYIIPVSKYPPGEYLLMLHDGSQILYNEKVIFVQ